MPLAHSWGAQAERRQRACATAVWAAPASRLTPPANGRVGVEVAEHEVGVGHRRLAGAAAIRRRAGVGPGRTGSDAQGASGVTPGDRAATGPDGVDGQRGQGDRAPGDLATGMLGDGAILDHTDVAGGAAHVEAQTPLDALGPRGEGGPGGTPGGPGQHGQGGVVRGGVEVEQASVGADDRRQCQASLAARLGQAPQVAGQQRGDRRIELGGGGAFVFAEGADEFAGEVHRDLRRRLGERLGDERLVLGVAVGVQQHDRHGADVVGGPTDHQTAHLLRRESLERARGGHPLGGAETQLGPDQRRGSAGLEAVELGAVLTGQLDHIGEALGGDECRPCGVTLQERVGTDGHAVGEPLDVLGLGARLGQDRRDGGEYAAGLVLGGGGGFGGDEAASVASTASVKVPPTSTPRSMQGAMLGPADPSRPGAQLRQATAATVCSTSSVSARCWWEGQ